MKATTLPTLPTCYYVELWLCTYLVVVRPRIWASELCCAAGAAHGGTAEQTIAVWLIVFKKVNYFKHLF